MKIQTTIITLLLATLLAGCGVKKEEHQRILTELEETKQALEQSESEVTKLKEKNSSTERETSRLQRELASAEQELTRIRSELSASSSRASELTSEVERLKKQDTYAFTEAGRLLDSGDAPGALRAYTAFVRDFPSSPQVETARQQIALVTKRLEEEAKSRAQEQLAARLRTGSMTAREWAPHLRGKSKAEVIALLGQPDDTWSGGDMWSWDNRGVNAITGKKGGLYVTWSNYGSVYTIKVDYNGEEVRP